MPYCTSTDITDRVAERVVIELCDDERESAVGDTLAAAIVANAAIETRITAAIADADTMIDTYIRKRYNVPVTDTSATLTKLSADLAIYNLHNRRQSEFDIPEGVIRSRTTAVDILKGINKAQIDIGIDPPPAASSAVKTTASGEDRIFTEDSFSDM